MCSDPIPGARVLVVEDNEEIRKILVRFLQSVGMDVTEVATGQQALKLTRVSSFNVILTDLGLPDMDGAQLIREFRQLDTGVRIVILSGSAPDLGLGEFADLRVDGMLQKPLELRHLLEEVRRLIAAGPWPISPGNVSAGSTAGR